jgi:AcrR family transcriptional regulator
MPVAAIMGGWPLVRGDLRDLPARVLPLMPRRSASKAPMNTPGRNPRRATQRERLLAGMIDAANRDGYGDASVARVLAEAGVSRATFYDYFGDRDECFIAAITAVQERLLEGIIAAVEAVPPDQALASALRATFAFAESERDEARFLMSESLAGGPKALDARDAGLRETAQLIESKFSRAPAEAVVPDLPVLAVLGATHRLLATRLRRGERALNAQLEALITWTASYGQLAGEHRWRKLKPHRAPARSPYLSPVVLPPPRSPGPGRPRVSEAEVVENHRRRIMFATAQIVQERGYPAVRVAEITRRAGVDGHTFYQRFTDKQEAFGAIHELGFQYLMASTAGAFFTEGTWPQRIWEALRAASQIIDDAAAFSHVAFVEAYAIGPQGVQRVEDSRMAFAIFLQEGYRDERSVAVPPSRLALEAIVTTIFEIIYLQVRANAKPRTARLLAHMVHICLTPFLGAELAAELIAMQMERP